MSEPIIEQIVCNMRDALGVLRKSANYVYDVYVSRAFEVGTALGNDDATLLINEESIVEAPDEAPGAVDCYRAVINLDFYVRNPESSKVPPGTVLNRLDSDIRIICRNNNTWGGLALNTEFTTPSKEGFVGQMNARRITISVLYYTALSNPFSQ